MVLTFISDTWIVWNVKKREVRIRSWDKLLLCTIVVVMGAKRTQ